MAYRYSTREIIVGAGDERIFCLVYVPDVSAHEDGRVPSEKGQTAHSPDAQSEDGTTHVASAATNSRRPLIVFSHELGNTHASGIPYAESLAERGYAVCLFDFRGGSVMPNRSGGSSVGMSIMTEAADLERVLSASRAWDFVDPARTILLGASQGGVASSVAAGRNPELAAGLILLYPAFSAFDDSRASFPNLAAVPETYDLFGGWMTVGRNYAADIWDYDVATEIAKYPGPVLILHGDTDTTVPLRYSEQVAAAYAARDGVRASVELLVIPGGRHEFSGEPLERATAEVERFVAATLAECASYDF